MTSQRNLRTYTPEQVAEILQLKRNTVYRLIGRGEIIAKKLGRSYRIPATSLSFAITGLDADLYRAEQDDLANLSAIHKALESVRHKER